MAKTLGRTIAVRQVADTEEAHFPGGAPKVLADTNVEGFFTKSLDLRSKTTLGTVVPRSAHVTGRAQE
ncbi:hypothetical protein AB0H00_01610 [Nocardia sp. NPDC023852]|uniref:hypothetical protein n=1 Tax=Nocardia sp. NPDC023852 TaxID=3154697 RepID=UPI0033F214C5